MTEREYTQESLTSQWLIGELLADYMKTGNFSLTTEFLQVLPEDERERVLDVLFWYGLNHLEWKLAEDCLNGGYPIVVPDRKYGPLHEAVISIGNRPDIVQWLIDHGAQVNQQAGGWGMATPLMYASARGYDDIVKILLENGADPNLSTKVDDDETPLMCAVMSGSDGIARLLLEYGADIHRKNRWGKSIVEIADEHGHDKLANWLRDELRRLGTPPVRDPA